MPNTTEDLLEFMILATSKMNYSAYEQNPDSLEGKEFEAWYAKMNQVYQKAKNSHGNENDFKKFEELYEESKKKFDQIQKKKSQIIKFGLVLAFLISIGSVILLFFLIN